MGRAKEFDTESVLRKATAVFGAYGYEGTSLTVLLNELGIARQSLYDTYGTKHDLFVSALKFYIQQKTEAGIRLLNECTSVRQGMEQLFNEAVNVLSDEGRRNECFIINSAVEQAPQNHEIADFIQASNKQMEDTFLAALIRGHKNGEFNHAEDELLGIARFLNYSRLSLTFTAKSGASTEVLRELVRTTLRVLN
ncbi:MULTISPECIES: TetR/AcrR family transcriptional regulator [unclassified Paenibacillus]|uniref:TetR/AcrR family transcriptional regulator n=1 Tax=unclassified Paenibacillus TaxID=185978 RepID=UPI0009A911C0|nr:MULTISPECIES: TetR/AcrR family transcriptional regulator [unclassified Paenibacillus]SLJ95638.1 transcriptional regulator, TetR family [Paenibacillus sp. RU5A]SOC67284.1 transcriptional regulator, TetR family [Paenibacillus sp. RU26A]SOC69374.1 transcriptional regulator, TetR family [Paenibacillus sp. RU5M]